MRENWWTLPSPIHAIKTLHFNWRPPDAHVLVCWASLKSWTIEMGHHISINPGKKLIQHLKQLSALPGKAFRLILYDIMLVTPCTRNRARLTGWDRRLTKCHAECVVPPPLKRPFPRWRAARLDSFSMQHWGSIDVSISFNIQYQW